MLIDSAALKPLTETIAEQNAEIDVYRRVMKPVVSALTIMDATGRQGQPLCTPDGKPLLQYAELDGIRSAYNGGA